ncbi:uncharacterized protein LOC127726005 [Mytilus californianus]|uniref:uncharacterized protein LOC127726005 n=1 Tax=Mytilus californianus TaxID=6549 RepID=UPI002245DECD|nr:uncharacterized protein LOC127726005 [Mytilus californianus]
MTSYRFAQVLSTAMDTALSPYVVKNAFKSEWRKQIEEKEEKKNKQTKRQPRQNGKTTPTKQKPKKKAKKQVVNKNIDVENNECGDDFPVLSRPKQKRKRKTVDGGMDISTNGDMKDYEDDECYTCGVCGVRGCVQDDNNGILWDGCDNDNCMKWYHRGYNPNDELPYIDLSLIVDSDWHCFICRNNVQNDNTFICQVCMLTEENVLVTDDEMFWMHCSVCRHMFHQSCVPSNIFTNYQRCLAVSRQWVCAEN